MSTSTGKLGDATAQTTTLVTDKIIIDDGGVLKTTLTSVLSTYLNALWLNVTGGFVGFGFATQATAAGTTTLTAASKNIQEFTGSDVQNVLMPVATTLSAGRPFRMVNKSTGDLTIQSSGANTIIVVKAGTTCDLTLVLASGTTAASWAFADFQLVSRKDISGGYPGLTLFKLNMLNVAGTFTSFLTNTNTAARTYTFKDYDSSIPGMVSDFLIFKSTAASGVKVDEASPAYGFADLRGHFIVDSSGANAPVVAAFDTGSEELGYNASDIARWEFHVEHRDVTGGSKGLHVHFKKARSSTAATTNLVISAVVKHSYHNFTGQTARGASPAPITVTFTVTPTEFNAVPDGSTGITPDIEIFNEGGTGGKLNSLNILPDDDINVTITVTTVPTITGGATARVGLPHCDIHRQVRDMSGTKNKDDIAGSFYGTT